MKEIKLTQGLVTVVDDEDFEWLNAFKWYAHKQRSGGYRAVRMINNGESKLILAMHRAIMGVVDSKTFVDHKDHDGLNNQKSNLRICTQHQNNFNKSPSKNGTSKYLGVSLHKQTGTWLASITHNRKQKKIGYFKKEEDAAKTYNEWAKNLFGEFANLNNV